MKKLLIFVILSFYQFTIYSQVIKGTIIDNTTKEVIISASVFFSGTSVGTLSDEKGNFQLNISKYPIMPLTVSAIGYNSITLKDYSKDKPNIISLSPKTFELNEVVIKEKSHWLKRSENLTIFRNEFLGTTGNSMNSVITNEKDIRFKTSVNDDTLTAYSINPLLIENKALGYKITYFLDKFEYCKLNQSFIFEGKVLFKEDTAASSTKKAYFQKRRKATYLGSRMHFVRSLWFDNLNSSGFTVRNSAGEMINYKRIVFEKTTNNKYLRYHGGFGISYYTKQPTSFVTFRKELVLIDPTGYFEADGIIWEGEMARQRIADLLPYDYVIFDHK